MEVLTAGATSLNSGEALKLGSLVTQIQKNMRLMPESASPLNACACEVRLGYDVRRARCCLRANQPNPLPQTAKF